MAPITFQIETCDFDFGDFCLGGDWLIEIESDGYDFAVTDVISCKRSQRGPVIDLIKSWVSGDLARADKKSLVRQDYNDAIWQSSPECEMAAGRADHDREMRLSAAL